MKKLNILLVNDDGIKASGIHILKDLLKNYGDVYIMAPTHHMSGKGCSLSINKSFLPIKYNENEYHIDGTPVDCVKIGLVYFKNIKFDLVCSGCNNGENISYDTLYSGTVGATIEACINGYKSIAFSNPNNDYSQFEKHFSEIMRFIISNKLLSKNYILNVNMPSKMMSKCEVQLTKNVFRKDKTYEEISDEGIKVLREINIKNEKNYSDSYAFNNGIISISMLKPNLFDNNVYNKLIKKVKK